VRVAAFVLALLTALVPSSAVFAHASLVRAEPADGALVHEPPASLRLTFNEPVTPLVMRLIAPDGTTTSPGATAENAVVIVRPPPLRRGTHVLSWRVVSADGHPVGGSIVFSVGEASAPPAPGALPAGDRFVRSALWAVKLVFYLALFVGIGGVFARTWMSGETGNLSVRSRASGNPDLGVSVLGFQGDERTSVGLSWLDRVLIALIVAGFVATPLSVGLQGLDALELRLSALAQRPAWETGLATSYGMTAIVAMFALFAGLFALDAASRRAHAAARGLSLFALLAVGVALSLSGHASNAAPQWLTRPSVFIHAVCVAFWVGALSPLIASVRVREVGALATFSRLIPIPLAALVVSGAILAVVQLDRVDALWTTSYGAVLSVKIVLVVALLALAAFNRSVLTPRCRHGDDVAAGSLVRTMVAEFCIVVAILALVATWRFTPPPRALAASETVEVHLHGARAMAHLSLTPVRARDPLINIEVLDADFNALPVKEVTIIVCKPDAGIEPVRRTAVHVGEGHWRVDSLRIAVAGQWIVRVDLLIDDFEKLVLEDQVALPRLP
jgi:copper transport protein